MITLLGPNYVLQPVTEDDMITASLVWGITIGFGSLTVWTAIKQTVGYHQRRSRDQSLFTPYTVMIWLELLVCFTFSIICWMYLRGIIHPSFAFYFCILTLWALQVQFLLQIIINRVSILMVDRRKARHIKFGVAAFITAINISVYCIWIPARLQISDRYVAINNIWDHCEKSIYLVVDACLNVYFIRTVQKTLVTPGLAKYRPLVRFNSMIIVLSLSMDVLIIGAMSLPNTFEYMIFHPLAYTVKLKIEMSMADLITSVARTRDDGQLGLFQNGVDRGQPRRADISAFNAKSGTAAVVKVFGSTDGSVDSDEISKGPGPFGGSRLSRDMEMGPITTGSDGGSRDESPDGTAHGFVVHRHDEVRMEYESLPSQDEKRKAGGQDRRGSDETPFVGKERLQTKVWGTG